MPEPQPAHSPELAPACFTSLHSNTNTNQREIPPKSQGICFVLRLAAKKVTETKTAHKKKKKKPRGTFQVSTDVHCFSLNLPWGWNACAHAEGLRVSHPTLAQFAGLRLHCSYTTPLCAVASCPLLRWPWADFHACLKCGNWAMWDQMTVHLINWTALINFSYLGESRILKPPKSAGGTHFLHLSLKDFILFASVCANFVIWNNPSPCVFPNWCQEIEE